MYLVSMLTEATAVRAQAIVTVPIGSMEIGWRDLLYTALVIAAIWALIMWRHRYVKSRPAAKQEEILIRQFNKRVKRNILGKRVNWIMINPRAYTISSDRIIEIARQHGHHRVPTKNPSNTMLKFMPIGVSKSDRPQA